MWVRLDPRRAVNHKILTAGIAANGLDVAAMCWSALQEKDGKITVDEVATLARMHGCNDWEGLADTLVRVGRWTLDKRKNTYTIRDFLEYNFSKAQLEERRKRDRIRKHKPSGSDADSVRNPDGSGTAA